MSITRNIGLELRDGLEVGRDPRQMTAAKLAALGHNAMSPLKALRLRCIDCCAGSSLEVRLCTAVGCPAWPFRMGKNPWRSKAASNTGDVAPASGSDMAATLTNPVKTRGNPSKADVPGTPLPEDSVPTENMQFLNTQKEVAS